MKTASFDMLLQAASRHNILTITTRCGTSCIFCSHHQNPAGLDVYKVNDISIEELNSLMDFIDEDEKIIIGESATRICEGEPFAHTEIMEILSNIRLRFPNTPIQLTTSGVYLNSEILTELKRLSKIELNISLNSCSEEGRKKLYNGKHHMETIWAIDKLRDYDIDFNASIVAMPHVVGWKDIEDSIRYLCDKGAGIIRVFTPGYTKYSKAAQPPENIEAEIRTLLEALRVVLDTPIISEPPNINSFKAEVMGVMASACAEGIFTGDIIRKVNDATVISRVDAYYKLFHAKNPKVELLRKDMLVNIEIKKSSRESAGLVFEYDIHPDTIKDITKAIGRNKGKKCCLLTSELAYGILSECFIDNNELKVCKVRNEYFGGNIKCAGLLTINDIIKCLDSKNIVPEVIIAPGIMYDYTGKDLTGIHYMELADRYGCKIEII